MPAATRLVADVGGTNTRIALYDEQQREFRAVTGFHNRDYRDLSDIIDHWRQQLDETWPTAACIAAAAPPAGDQVTMVNIGWSFSRRAMAREFGFTRVGWLNDFQANAHALPHLSPSDLHLIHAGQETRNDILATVGPGTGLGGATLRQFAGVPYAADAEPGHAGLSPGNELELEIFRALLPRHGDIYAELLVSGIGLVRLYNCIASIHGACPRSLEPADVSTRALQGSDEHCVLALDTFCSLLGSACGDFVLANGAYGGLFIAGGIVPRMIDFLQRSTFLARFQAKGAMREHLEAIPVNVISADNPGLIGAAHAPLQAG
ncbi:glucokinase [Seongchinamella sediminis]|uniref:Glucokinase n=1 Tax=Seongchinamella sediminis TaxID=2283635 RepID=A0A3L7E4N6_9GAMM|nr:glucokinase [Seongchinamella sediminis]RLQ23452.1 glucokinase [Seongchinamella sediminis]